MNNRNRLEELLAAYTQNKINAPEFEELCELLKEEKSDAELKELLQNEWKETPFVAMDQQKLDGILHEVLSSRSENPAPVHRIHFLRINRWWAAASIILLLGAGAYFMLRNKADQHPELAKNQPSKSRQDINAPSINKATITLINGQTVTLDSVQNGLVAQQNNMQLVKLTDGQVTYRKAGDGVSTEVQYNTLTNPRGSTVIDLTLSDGTRVWLNAGSSLTYPVVFAGTERKVTITGEAYFEVAHNAAMPFKVKRNEWEVQVLGTHFNVNTYDDESATKVTLLEGSVKVSNPYESQIIQPGQQAQVASGIKLINRVDIDAVMAWKNGQFVLSGTDIKTLMRQVSRWYDVDVVYNEELTKRAFGGSIDRNIALSRVIQALGENGVKCKLENHTITVGK